MEPVETVDPNTQLVQMTINYRDEAKEAKRDRMLTNKKNFDCYHLRQDFSHKMEGQSKEFLSKQSMAVEQITTFFHQGLVDIDEWFSLEAQPNVRDKDAVFTAGEAKLILADQLDKADVFTVIHDALKLGLLGSLMIVKVHGKRVPRPVFVTEPDLISNRKKLKRIDKKFWQLHYSIIRQEEYFPDPSGNGLYEIHETFFDLDEVFKLSEGKDAIYDPKVVAELASAYYEGEEEKVKKARETNQNPVYTDYRKKIKITECWGSVLDSRGRVIKENVTWTVANDQFVIQEPIDNPFWHGASPFVTAPIIRVPRSVWHRALMDAPTQNNTAINELYNLIVDGGMMATHGIKQLRTDALENVDQVSNGISPGTTLNVTSALPYGAKVLERVDTASLSPESLQVFNVMQSEFNQSALTNDLRLGVLPARAVKATEVVEASQTITSVFTGIAKIVEGTFIEQLLQMSWDLILQEFDEISAEDMRAILGDRRAQEIAAISREDRFAKAFLGHKVKVFGVSRTLDKVKDFRKLTALLQTISGSEILTEEFIKKYDFGKLLGQIMTSLDIDVERLTADQEDVGGAAMAQLQGQGGQPGQPGQENPMAGLVKGPNAQSQIPQASTGSLNGTIESRIPRGHFPPSPISNLSLGGKA